MKVHLVDGTYELFRAYYGAPSATATDGREVGATRAFGRSMLALLAEPEVTHVACAFDTVIESFRNELFDGYKTGEGIDPALFAQFPLAEAMTRALGIVCWSMIEFEADDALATGAARYSREENVQQVVICSPDKDLCQCVAGDRVVCFDRLRRRTFDEPGVVERLGVTPGAVPDYLALVGDSADGIPGVPRWGAKSASAVLGRYSRLEDIPDAVTDWDVSVRGAKALADELKDHRDAALLYRRLATLRVDVPLTEARAEDLRWTGPQDTELAELCTSLGDDTLPARARALAPS